MPDTLHSIRCTFPALALLVACVALGGCSGGDFGRTRQDFINDDMHRWIGGEATSSIGLRPSQFQLTDNERQLRDLAYPLIEPPHSRPAWRSVFGDYQPLPSPWRQAPAFDRTAYGRALIDEPHRSHSSRYANLIDDVRDDVTRFEPFFASAVKVLELDRKRNASLAHVSELSPRERDDAIARMQENTLIVQWVQQCLAAGFLLPLGAGAAGDPGARRHGSRCRSPDRRACVTDRQPTGHGRTRHRPRAQYARLRQPFSAKIIARARRRFWRGLRWAAVSEVAR